MTPNKLPTLASYATHLETDFQLADPGGVTLTLTEAVPLSPALPDERRFSLLFRGPAQPLLAQATYTLAHPALGSVAIFLVPVKRSPSHAYYQAIFN